MKKLLLLFVASAMALQITNAQPKIDDSFFEKVNFIGAFGTTDWTKGWANFDCQNAVYAETSVNVSGEITGNVTWTADKVYLIQGFVYVVNGAVLTIEPGTVIRGEKSSMGSLIVERGGKIMAEGTLAKPIVFTSNVAAGSRVRGDWGGVVLCGKASVNQPGGEVQIEGGPRTIYGGATTPDDNDNSGILKYVRIEFAGYPFQPDKEINGLTFGGVGRGTSIDYIQVSYSNDDSYEWFGGTVNCKHLIAYRGLDDEFDTDFGFQGKIQFIVGLRDSAVADKSQSNGFESDNDAKGNDYTPLTQALISNASLFGPKATESNPYNPLFRRAMHIRRNSALNVYNSIFVGWPQGLVLDGSKTLANAETKDLLHINNSIISGSTANKFFGVGTIGTGGVPAPADSMATIQKVRSFFLDASRSNDTLATNDLLNLEDPFNYASPNFLPKTGSILLSKGSSFGKSVSTIEISTEGNVTSIKTNQTLQLSAVVNPNEALNKEVEWSIEVGNDVATISEIGLISPIKAGSIKVKAAAKDGSGISKTIDLTIEAAGTKVNDVKVSQASLWPNPTSDVLKVQSTQTMKSIEIINNIGQKVLSTSNLNSENANITVSSLHAGYYLVKVLHSNGDVSVSRMLKK